MDNSEQQPKRKGVLRGICTAVVVSAEERARELAEQEAAKEKEDGSQALDSSEHP